MSFDPKFDTVLNMTCRACGHVDHYLVPESDAVAVEAAFCDRMPTLSFECLDKAGELRTTNLVTEDYRAVQRAPLTAQELAEMRKPKRASAVDLGKALPGLTTTALPKPGGRK